MDRSAICKRSWTDGTCLGVTIGKQSSTIRTSLVFANSFPPGVFGGVGLILLFIPIYLYINHHRRQVKMATKMTTIEAEREEQKATVEKLAIESPDRLTPAQKLAFEGKKAWRDSVSMTSTARGSWDFGSLDKLEGVKGRPGSSLRSSAGTPTESRSGTPDVARLGMAASTHTRSQNTSVSSTSTIVNVTFPDSESKDPVQEAKPAPLPTTMYGFHLPRPQAGRARTYSLSLAAEQAARQEEMARASVVPPADGYFAAHHRDSLGAEPVPSMSHKDRLAARRLKGRSSSASALDQFASQKHKLYPPSSPLASPDTPRPISVRSRDSIDRPRDSRVVNSGFVVSRPRSGSLGENGGLPRASVGPSWHQQRMRRMESAGSLGAMMPK
jgi:hypothetical protein